MAEVEEMQRNIAEMAKAEGIEFNWEGANSGNTFNAHRLIHLAQSKGLGNEAQEAFFYSYMTQGLAIGERETLEDVAARIGLNPVEVDDLLDSEEYADFVKFDQEVAHEQLKVTGVPFFVLINVWHWQARNLKKFSCKYLKKRSIHQPIVRQHSAQQKRVTPQTKLNKATFNKNPISNGVLFVIELHSLNQPEN